MIKIIWIFAVFAAIFSAERAAAQDTLVVAKHIDKVENWNAIQDLWKTVSSNQFKAIAVRLGWPELAGGIQFLQSANVVHFSDAGEDHKGAIQAPIGYTVCHAVVRDPSVTCNGTFTGSYRTADDPASANVDGLHYYVVVPHPHGIAPGRCWVDGTVIVTFIRATPGARERSQCGHTGSIAFHYGK